MENPVWRTVGFLRPQSLTSSASRRLRRCFLYGKLMRVNHFLCCSHGFRYGEASPMRGSWQPAGLTDEVEDCGRRNPTVRQTGFSIQLLIPLA